MIRIRLTPAWQIGTDAGTHPAAPLMLLLEGIERTGKLTEAARAAGLSYRHAWGVLRQWQETLGTPLVDSQRARGAQLTELGQRFLQAQRRVAASLERQLQALAQDAETSLNGLFNAPALALRLHASHDQALAMVRDMADREARVGIDLQFKGSLEALASLGRGRCDLAGFHLPQPPAGELIRAQLKPLLKPRLYQLVRFVSRQQGLILAPGNPLNIQHFVDLARPGVHFINRQPGSGTRMLVDQLILDHGLNSQAIDGYHSEEFTHFAIAATVASGLADAGVGTAAAARQFHLDFIPLAWEDYYLAGRQDSFDQPAVRQLIDLLQSDAYQAAVAGMAGYEASRAGERVAVRDLI